MNPSVSFDGPAIYRIRVQGRLKAQWASRLGGMAISVEAPDDGPPITRLEGELLDQAALSGVLSGLYGLHLPVLSVDCLSARSNDPGG